VATKISYFVASYRVVYIYSTLNYYTEQNSVLFSIRVSVLFSIYIYIDVVNLFTKENRCDGFLLDTLL